jgi:hypothetical protein
MQWTPGGVTWFNYTATPSFNAQAASLLSVVSIDLSQLNLVTSFVLNPRYDMVPSGVIFNYVGIAQCNVMVPTGCADPSTGIVNAGAANLSQDPVTVQTITQDTGGTTNTTGVLVGTIDLQQLTGTTTENPPTGLANSYYQYLLSTFWDGHVTTQETEVSGNLRPGKVLNITNGQSAWATMKTPIQEVTEELYTGVTTATIGTPGHLAPQTFAYLVNMTARRPLVVSGLAAVTFPGSTDTNCPQGINPQTQKLLNQLAGAGSSAVVAAGGTNGANYNRALPSCSIAVCVGGVSKNISVYCANPSQ